MNDDRPTMLLGPGRPCGASCILIGATATEAQTSSSADLTEVDISSYPWSSIAKLNHSVGGSCTAVAIEQDRVLTAAHCVFNRRTSRFLPPSSHHVLFGYERGKYAVHVWWALMQLVLDMTPLAKPE